MPDPCLDRLSLGDYYSDECVTLRDTLPWEVVTHQSPYFTELEAARYCRCGVARLRSWTNRRFLEVRTDVDGRRFYLRNELDRVMNGLAEPVVEPVVEPVRGQGTRPARREEPAPSRKAEAKPTAPAKGPVRPAKDPARPALPFTDPENDTRRRRRGTRQ